MTYNYREALQADIRAWLAENPIPDDLGIYYDAEEYLHETLWDVSEVTGNGNYDGCNGYDDLHEGVDFEVFVKDNLELAVEALREFGSKAFIEDNWIIDENLTPYRAEFIDVTIRVYLLGEAIAEVLRG